MVCFGKLGRSVRAFLADERGNAGLEFVTSVPLLLGVLVFTAEYGQVLRERMVLDNAAHDVARYLARAPLDNLAVPPAQPQVAFYAQTLTEARAFLEARIQDEVGFSAVLNTVDQGNFRTEYHVIQVRVRTNAGVPLLSFINSFSARSEPDGRNGQSDLNAPNDLVLTLTSETQVRWLGGAEPGSADCLLANRYQGLCP